MHFIKHTVCSSRTRYTMIAGTLLMPLILAGGQSEQYVRVTTLVERALNALRPDGNAVFNFRQHSRRLGHLSRPWQTYELDIAGAFSLADGAARFYRTDSIHSGGKTLHSFTYRDDSILAFVNFGRDEPAKLTASDLREFSFEVSVLTPVFLLEEFLGRRAGETFLRHVRGAVDSVVYRTEEGSIVSLAIDAGALELRSARIISHSDLYGDVERTIFYDTYISSEPGGFRYPSRIVERLHGFVANEVSIEQSSAGFDTARIARMIPASYVLAPDPPAPVVEIERTDLNEHVHLLDLKHASTRVLVVEFADFVLVAGAPLNSRNGELIVENTRRTAPSKPIRYFTFGHHHAHYIGGIRAFVHAGAEVITMAHDSAYVRQLASFPRTLRPDSLALSPRPLKLEAFEGERTISDGDVEVRIVHIGMLSQHTEDFLLYYFPQFKLLYQDDLAWIPAEGPVAAAGRRQKGLYDAVVHHRLDVDTIIQAWPLGGEVKNVFTFDELRRSVELLEAKE